MVAGKKAAREEEGYNINFKNQIQNIVKDTNF